MQITIDKKDIKRSANFVESSFGIQASSKAFQILSSALYSRKEEAIVRELCTNASDAHVAAGIPEKPIKVVVPSAFEPRFIVKDWGKGIDPEEFQKIYTTYFYSTKTETNTQTGCFGLGSKSPFAYTDQFSVENCYNGKKYVYQCFKNELGEPAVALLGTSDTTDTGIKVSFHVKPHEVYLFEAACMRVLQWFDVAPEINIDVTNLAKSEEIFRVPTSDWQTGFRIRMGQVIYPVPNDILNPKRFGTLKYVVNAPIGSVDITPSRESLEMTNKTEEFIELCYLKMEEKLKQEIEDILNSDMTKFEKYIKINDGASDYGRLRPVEFINEFARIDSDKTVGYTRYEKSSWRKSLTSSKWDAPIYKDTCIVIKDKKTGVQKRIAYLLSTEGQALYLHIVKHAMVFAEEDKPYLYSLGFEDRDFINLSSITVPSTPSNQSYNRKKTNCCRANVTGYKNKKIGAFLDKTENDGFYIMEDQFDNFSHLRRAIENLDEEVYVFTENQYKFLKISDRNFKHIGDHYKDIVLENRDKIAKALHADNVKDSKMRMAKAVAEITTSDNALKSFVEKYSTPVDEKEVATLELAASIMESHDYELYDSIRIELRQLEEEFKLEAAKVWENYPMAKLVLDKFSSYDIINEVRQVAEYVDLIENTKGSQN